MSDLTIAKLRDAIKFLSRAEFDPPVLTYLSQDLYDRGLAAGHDMTRYAVLPHLDRPGPIAIDHRAYCDGFARPEMMPTPIAATKPPIGEAGT